MNTTVSIVIPTYGREQVLVETLSAVLELHEAANEVLVVDQTPNHEPAVETQLAQWDAAGRIRWLRLPQPSITRAMNVGLQQARGGVVLFLDDDVIPADDLVARHAENYADPMVVAVVGQVLQPGQQPTDKEPRLPGSGLRRDLDFLFNSSRRSLVDNCMAGNLSVRRLAALAAGGFDEHFVGVAFRFETEFARRLNRIAGKVVFDGRASIRHLQAPRGGTRVYGDPWRSASPAHGVGDYYFALREGRSSTERVIYFACRLRQSLGQRLYLREPWWLPVKLLGEFRAMAWALRLAQLPPALLQASVRSE